MLFLFQGCLRLSFKNGQGLVGRYLDRMAGLQDLQDRLFWLNWWLFGQDGRIAGFTG